MMPAEDRRHAEMIEALRRISTGIEVIVNQNDKILDQLREVTARFEAALRYSVESWKMQKRRQSR